MRDATKQQRNTPTGERISVSLPMNQAWKYASGDAMARFCEGLKQKKIEALQCEQCERRYLPPRPFCGNCHKRLEKWVDVQDEGTIEAWTVLNLPMLDGRTGKPRATPYGMALIKLDGADTTLNHYLGESDPSLLRIGGRVKAVWREELIGAMSDISYFEVLP